MKNLELLELVHKTTKGAFSDVKLVSPTPDYIYYIRDNFLHRYDFTCGDTSQLCPHNFEGATHLKALVIENKICVVICDQLQIVNLNGTQVQSIQFRKKISVISWNPTEELAALVFHDGEIATYNIDYENAEIFPQGKSSIDAKIPDTVYVGWGSKDTQFRGSEGKLKNQIPVETKPVIDHNPTISWRGNGEMFVVNYWVDEKRQFVVFETPCKALYRSEDCPGLQAPVAWRPAGNMIAGLSEIVNKQSIVIFEKNGQKRFDFELNFDEKVTELKWSPCAQIFCIRTLTETSQTIRLFTSSNYKWYQKQLLEFSSNNPLIDFDWVETNQFIFILRVITQQEVIKYTFRNIINKNSTGVCAVIDGNKLNLTDFKDSVIPPILYSRQFLNDNQINFVTFFNELIAILDCKNNIKIFNIGNPDTIITTIDLNKKLELHKFPLFCHHLIFNEKLYFSIENDTDTIFYSVDLESHVTDFISATSNSLQHFFVINDNSEILGLQKIDNNLYINESDSNSVFEVIKIIDNQKYLCRLTPNCHFYLNDTKISDCVNSFTIFESYLIYTTKQNELFCLRLGQECQHYHRNIEQGAIIVTTIPETSKIVLQLPRGNLETISCRLISIDILDKLLSQQKWEEAIRFIRIEKLNSNLLFDLNSARFLDNVSKFVEGVKTINELNAICLEFEEGNVLNSLYKNWGKSDDFPNKILTIFGKLFKYFDSFDYSVYVTTIMAVNLNFFTLRDALIYLQDLYRRNDLKDKLFSAVNTLKNYGCDQEKLYCEALLLYDLDLAHFIATCCQLDPRIYEPHIKQLKDLTEVEKRYEINLFAKKFKTAIAYLLRFKNDPNEILTFIQTYNVSREAYENCPRTNQHYQTISEAFARDLSIKGCHHESGVILKRAGLLEKALDEFKLGLCWKEVLDLLEELKVEQVEKVRIVDELGKRLMQHNIKDAAILFENYGNNYEMAVKILVEGCFFDEAIHIARKYNRGDIIVSDVIPMLIKHKSYLYEKLTNLNDSYNKYRQRLAQVRLIKHNKFNNNYDDCDDRDDLFSDASSTISRSSRSSRSRSSTASSRNRRKEEKKKQDLREGGIYEDIALIRALHGTIKEFYNKGEEVRNCCILLLQESDISYGEIKKLHEFYWKIDANIQSGLSEIWPPHFYKFNQTYDSQELADLENLEHLDLEFRTPPGGRTQWKLHVF